LWRITESDARDVPGALGITCLVFDSQAICRRFWTYPANWISLPEEHLLDFMNQSRPSAG
jgi:hypothetical protein